MALVTVALHSTTLLLSPVYWLDEAQILDWGRSLVFEPHTTWSVSWLPEGRPAVNYGFLGPALQEGVFRLAGLQPWAPRLSAILGGVAAATMLLAWLWARGLGARASVIGGAALLFEPAFVQACRGGRVDGWAIALALGAAWALRIARGPRGHGTAFAILAGVLAAAAPFVWPTALIVLLAAGLELVQLGHIGPRGRPERVPIVAAFVAAGATTAAILVAGYIALHGNPLAYVSDALAMQFTTGAGVAQTWGEVMNAVIETVVRSPGLWMLAILAALVPAARPLAVVAALALVVLAPTHLYVFRLLYVLPLIAAAVASAYDGRQHLVDQGRHRLASTLGGLLLVSIAWNAFTALGARQVVAWSERLDRDPAQVYEIARRIGPGSHAVLLGAGQFYYPGRQLGWRMFRPFHSTDLGIALLARMDFVITEIELDRSVMEAAGLVAINDISPPAPSSRYGAFRLYRRVIVGAAR